MMKATGGGVSAADEGVADEGVADDREEAGEE